MLEFIDRVPAVDMANKKAITYADGRTEIVTITSADNAITTGTPINRTSLMAVQGFIGKTTVFNDDGSITEINDKDETLTTTFNDDGSITETFVGEKTITKTTLFNNDGTITEVISQ